MMYTNEDFFADLNDSDNEDEVQMKYVFNQWYNFGR